MAADAELAGAEGDVVPVERDELADAGAGREGGLDDCDVDGLVVERAHRREELREFDVGVALDSVGHAKAEVVDELPGERVRGRVALLDGGGEDRP